MKYVEIIDNDNKVIGRVPEQEMRDKALLHRSCSVIVVTSDGKIYLPKRSKKMLLFPRCYELGASGAKEIGETLEECAKRELKEELGIESQKLKFLFEYKHRSKNDNYDTMVYICSCDTPLTLRKGEVEEGAFVPLTDLEKFLEKNKFAGGRKKILKRVLQTLPPIA